MAPAYTSRIYREFAMPQTVSVGAVAEFPPGDVKVVTHARKDIAVFNDAGSFFAIDDCCPHAGASLAGGHVEAGIVTCPWHAWRFRLCDGAWADNPKVKTGCYPVQVVEGQVRVEVPEATGG